MSPAKSAKPKIVFLDQSSVDLGDLDLSFLQGLGAYRGYPQSSRTQIISRAKEASIIITNKCEFDAKLLKQFPQLQLICVAATGVNNVELGYLKKHKIALCNVAGYSTESVAEHTLMMILAAGHRLFEHHEASLAKKWSQSPHFALLDYPFSQIKGKTLSIVGFGQIGKEVMRLAKAFGMNVLVSRLPSFRYPQKSDRLPLKQALTKADYVSIHCALSSKTHHLFNEQKLSWLKKEAVLINMARGPLVDEKAVAKALLQKSFKLYATDVLAKEPMPTKHVFYNSKLKDKIILSPHVAWASKEARQKLIDEIGLNIKAFFQGKKRNRLV